MIAADIIIITMNEKVFAPVQLICIIRGLIHALLILDRHLSCSKMKTQS